jgi:hypothetical protein
MSQMTITIVDPRRAIHSQPHASFVHSLIPSLCDDPETIEELRRAMRRFLAPDEPVDPFADWSPHECQEPFDAGICIVDLPGRLIVFQSTCSGITRSGRVVIDESGQESARGIPYHIGDDWLLTEQLDGWQTIAQERRQARQTSAVCDSRAVLYDQAVPFIVQACQAARGGSTDDDGRWNPPANWQWQELPERAAGTRPITILDGIAEIHARWLMTPRQDLNGQTPRQVLLAKREHIDWQLHDRELQWSLFRNRPASLWRKSAAYRCAAFGTHEIIVYYELLRHLLHECWEVIVAAPPDRRALTSDAAIERLRKVQQEWLHTPSQEYFKKSPLQLIECERQRVPLGESGKQAMIDCDCPLCQMMADSGPVFWHLDTSNMDDDFPFAVFETTREQWEAERHSYNESCDRMGTDADEKLILADTAIAGAASNSPWQRSFVRSIPGASPEFALYGIGCRLAELIDELRHAGSSERVPRHVRGFDDAATLSITAPNQNEARAAAQDWIDTLNRDFANLRAAVAESGTALVEPVAARFTEHLLALAETHADLRARCLDLDRQVFEFAQRLSR